ncbi:MAG: hypothetical protein K6F33_06810 [Bacteroidales bacterium]|nr:hypothetical protein [Bacteroidales bacterium]
MKTLLLTLALVLIGYAADAQTIDLGKFTIDKNACTITRKSDGKTFSLHGRVEIVDHNPDLRVEIVDHNPDVYVMAHYPCDCGEYELVDHNPDLRVELVDHNPDLTVEVRDHHPHINR